MAEMCATCQAEFATPAELIDHAKKAHATLRAHEPDAPNGPEETGTFKCGLCGATFTTPSRLAQHNLVPHSPAGPPEEAATV
jgi:hypothetical protein